ncbi:MAG: P1 family peptidase [Coriobacteriales bacterium]|jgi:L-aminopeptidase/D-esterase-like protein|nr:P1 family peptidase [Coriobacteriales bacterium]
MGSGAGGAAGGGIVGAAGGGIAGVASSAGAAGAADVASANADSGAAALEIRTGAAATLVEGFRLGHATDERAGTGCTVITCEQGALGALSVRGAAPATRESDLLDPRGSVERVNAVMLSGGSAFGLDAAGGAMRWLSERGWGLDVGGAVVPIVCGASLFDLLVGDKAIRPDDSFGYRACEEASSIVTVGNVGAATGASVGKLLGGDFDMKSGFGAASLCLDGLCVSALVALNALGTVFERASGRLIAGVRDPRAPDTILDAPEALRLAMSGADVKAAPSPGSNTTIGCVLTNALLTKAQATHIADMAHDGYARAIEPVHTRLDGDAVFILTTAQQEASPDVVGALCAWVMEAAVCDAALSATAAYGLPAARDLF